MRPSKSVFLPNLQPIIEQNRNPCARTSTRVDLHSTPPHRREVPQQPAGAQSAGAGRGAGVRRQRSGVGGAGHGRLPVAAQPRWVLSSSSPQPPTAAAAATVLRKNWFFCIFFQNGTFQVSANLRQLVIVDLPTDFLQKEERHQSQPPKIEPSCLGRGEINSP